MGCGAGQESPNIYRSYQRTPDAKPTQLDPIRAEPAQVGTSNATVDKVPTQEEQGNKNLDSVDHVSQQDAKQNAQINAAKAADDDSPSLHAGAYGCYQDIMGYEVPSPRSGFNYDFPDESEADCKDNDDTDLVGYLNYGSYAPPQACAKDIVTYSPNNLIWCFYPPSGYYFPATIMSCSQHKHKLDEGYYCVEWKKNISAPTHKVPSGAIFPRRDALPVSAFKAETVSEFINSARANGEDWAQPVSKVNDYGDTDKKDSIAPENADPDSEKDKDLDLSDEYAFDKLFRQAQAIEDGAKRRAKLTAIESAYKKHAIAMAKRIVDEKDLPLDSPDRTIKPLAIGGVAGGEKFISDSILVKFAVDPRVGENYLYGRQTPDPTRAAKACTNELKAATRIFQHFYQLKEQNRADMKEGLPEIVVPIQVMIEYKGSVLVAMPLLPLKDRSKLIYGSADAGRSVFNEIKQVDDLMTGLAHSLGLAQHQVGETILSVGGDIEVHVDTQGTIYILDCARLLPHDHYVTSSHLELDVGDAFCRVHRPEYLQGQVGTGIKMMDERNGYNENGKSPDTSILPEYEFHYRLPASPQLSSDALTMWGPEYVHHLNAIQAARVLVKGLLPAVAKWMDERARLDRFPLTRAILYIRSVAEKTSHLDVQLDDLQRSCYEDRQKLEPQDGNAFWLKVEKLVPSDVFTNGCPSFLKDKTYNVWVNTLDVAFVMHSYGISLRHMGLLFSLVQDEKVKNHIRREMLQRSLKHIVRKLLHDLPEKQWRADLEGLMKQVHTFNKQDTFANERKDEGFAPSWFERAHDDCWKRFGLGLVIGQHGMSMEKAKFQSIWNKQHSSIIQHLEARTGLSFEQDIQLTPRTKTMVFLEIIKADTHLDQAHQTDFISPSEWKAFEEATVKNDQCFEQSRSRNLELCVAAETHYRKLIAFNPNNGQIIDGLRLCRWLIRLANYELPFASVVKRDQQRVKSIEPGDEKNIQEYDHCQEPLDELVRRMAQIVAAAFDGDVTKIDERSAQGARDLEASIVAISRIDLWNRLDSRDQLGCRVVSPLALLVSAARNGHLLFIAYLLHNEPCGSLFQSLINTCLPPKKNSYHRFSTGMNALHHACDFGHVGVAQLLLNSGAEIDLSGHKNYTNFSFTPLIFAADGNHIDLVKLLISEGASVDQIQEEKSPTISYPGGSYRGLSRNPQPTALSVAIENGHSELAGLLIEAKSNLEDALQVDCMAEACSKGHIETVKLLLSCKADCNSGSRKSPLFAACEHGEQPLVKLLLESNCQLRYQELLNPGKFLNKVELQLCDALHVACQNEHVGIAEQLLEEGWKSDASGMDEKTPLWMIAETTGNLELTMLLLQRGADPMYSAWSDYHTVLMVAHLQGFSDMAHCIEHYQTYGQVPSMKEEPEKSVLAACISTNTQPVIIIEVANIIADYCGPQWPVIPNIGKAAYARCVVQMLYLCKPFRDNILAISDDPGHNAGLLKAFVKLFKDLENRSFGTNVSLDQFLPNFITYEGRPLSTQDSLDANEFFNMLADKLFSQQGKLNPDDQKLVDICQQSLKGKLINMVGGLPNSGCSHISSREEAFFSISVDISGCKTLSDCLTQYFEKEELSGMNSYRCRHCDERKDSFKGVAFLQTPDVLLIVLKCFVFDYETFEMKRLQQGVEIPVELDLEDFMHEAISDGKGESQHMKSSQSTRYHLRGGITHTGSTKEGYFQCLWRSDEGEWAVLDSRARHIDEEEALRILSGRKDFCGWKSGYLLAFTRVE